MSRGRPTAQLIDASTDAHLWAEKYSGTNNDIFDLQEQLSRRIVEALRVVLMPAEDSALAHHAFDNADGQAERSEILESVLRCRRRAGRPDSQAIRPVSSLRIRSSRRCAVNPFFTLGFPWRCQSPTVTALDG